MNTESKISAGQFFSLLLLSRLLTTLTFMPVFNDEVRTSDNIISMAVGTVLAGVFCIPSLLLFRKDRNNGIVNASYNISPVMSKIVSVFYVLLFLFYAFTTLARMELFVSTIVFPDMDTTFFIVISVIAACYAASLGFEALGRAGAVSLFVFCASFVIIMLTMTDKINLNNLSPAFYDGIMPVAKSSWDVLARTVEPAIIAVMLPRVTGNVKKGFAVWIIALIFIITTIFFYLMTSLGDCALLQLFPVHAMATLAEFSVLERLDVLLTGAWILSAFIKISFMVFLVSDLLSTSFKKEYKKYYILITGLILVIAMFIISRHILFFSITISRLVRSVAFILFVFLIPTAVVITGAIRKKVKK